ncbi:C-5 cytosine methyltransferase [Metarhizium album ARSEF 1941]|uniref:DNA (cytosine-5-)-methyltransferase n=1 Tax=Metarhizium album (strain ARSEF 1941) TaxID=1081103 RepID=A0A0B2WMQ0_METAS|nr:C-5 cytosine methyltransferase [Metarhizium album ARSEF 1941]KHN97336.1 C-5 cytosine methyltransferase [Metarhizium album ARSEF 1941]
MEAEFEPGGSRRTTGFLGETLPTGGVWTLEDVSSPRQEDSQQRSETARASSPSISAFSERTSNLAVMIPDLHVSSPRSCYEPFHPPAPVKSEEEALACFRLSPGHPQPQSSSSLGHFELQLDNFAVYVDTERYPCEMRCLHQLYAKRGQHSFFFDGVLSNNGESKTYVKRVPVSAVPVGQYGLQYPSVGDQVWLQSPYCAGSGLLYKLGLPAKEYRRFFEQFLWVANLSKHFTDFLYFMKQRRTRVAIHHFKSVFGEWLLSVHGGAPELMDWLALHPSCDFRTSVVANIQFLYKENKRLSAGEEPDCHDIWAEIWNLTKYPKLSPGTAADQPTVVTDYIYQLFSHLPFGNRLQGLPLGPRASTLRDGANLKHGLERACVPHSPATSELVDEAPQDIIRAIKPGDTISTKRDSGDSGSMWKRELSNGFADVDRWFALVQKVCKRRDGGKLFEVLWYYRPLDTLCGLMKYPWKNELFLSDHCSCHEKNKIQDDEFLGVHSVQFGGDSTTNLEFFCRQTYISEERKWVTLKDSDLVCSHLDPRHRESESSKYWPGDTFLIHVNRNSSTSQPCELISVYTRDKRHRLCFRRLLRRRDVDATAVSSACNELVYSSESMECGPNRIVGKCHVRFFAPDANIPVPYNRAGVGGFFYITHQLSPTGLCVPVHSSPPSLRQGFDPCAVIPKLRGLDLFCGGGNFGRGLEEGGAVCMNWANDHDVQAMHTYMANCSHPRLLSPYLGSIDGFQKEALDGNFCKSVPAIGSVDFISGGSPCPGFSRLTNDKTTDEQRKNQSLVAAFASCIDLYRPKYGLLENVPGIVQHKENREQDVSSQFICAIVGIGYQAQMFYLDSSSCGSAQRRSRVFISFAAPRYKLPHKPQQTHSHPLGTKSARLGTLSTGNALAEREFPRAAPFQPRTARQVMSGLPKIYNGQTDTCIAFPDHRLAHRHTMDLKARISLIPNRPWGMNFRSASRGVLTPAEKSVFLTKKRDKRNASANSCDRQSSAYGRLYPNQLVGAITTQQTAGDRKNGRQLHWDENRGLSVMEARRAQGFPDDEVILGTPREQYKIVGNSVAREVALALGLSIREAWAESCADIQNPEAAFPLARSLEPCAPGGHAHHSACHTLVVPQKRRRLTTSRMSVETRRAKKEDPPECIDAR